MNFYALIIVIKLYFLIIELAQINIDDILLYHIFVEFFFLKNMDSYVLVCICVLSKTGIWYNLYSIPVFSDQLEPSFVPNNNNPMYVWQICVALQNINQSALVYSLIWRKELNRMQIFRARRVWWIGQTLHYGKSFKFFCIKLLLSLWKLT